MKKPLALIIGLIIVAIAGTLFWRLRPKAEPEAVVAEKKRIVQPANIIPQEDRPYIAISPESDGKNITIAIDSIKKAATTVEYELEYQAGTLLQGAFGAIQLDTLPAREKILLGSCSAGGACTYHQDVRGGSLTTTFAGQEDYSLKTEWKYFENKAKESSFSSRDGKFQIEAKSLAQARYLIISQASGIPKGYDGKIISEPYSLQASSNLTGEGELSIRTNSEETASILGWNGTAWETYPTNQDGKTATATVPMVQLYVVIAK
ncbi:MAG: hypothetical protein GW946_01035 [Candidatus Pacebacteria bacterium]|nr:hypothetical protein [Candidatus Paceibacterota bacterium]PIR60695.1 MAG: hypothetical protein COU67_01035 [Candidatus Pacebacteria bacterium CG10_big_fil_rev_8_21_14_0_10_44_54]